ncbi:hypothetical protein RIF29_29102 [Crotalaria pallida]|uniref:Uncharacterized protein n=1 Tax=Crotalaria pallida TaxID=3830 RepID=A0AAN9HX61_CROPI
MNLIRDRLKGKGPNPNGTDASKNERDKPSISGEKSKNERVIPSASVEKSKDVPQQLESIVEEIPKQEEGEWSPVLTRRKAQLISTVQKGAATHLGSNG